MASKLYSKDAVGDLVLLEKLDEDSILQTLKRRHAQDLIYTYIGEVLISVNPFKEIRGMYDENAINSYRGRYMYELPPHVFALSEDTYRQLQTDREDQCVIITGESGAGKTEASKKIMQYIAAVSGNSSEIERVKEKILQSNPVLEAFGNAKTVRNNNSSRFGKYMEIFFDYKGDPVGGRITNYLLEKSRVVNPAPNERCFHIFYQLCSGASSSERKQYSLQQPDAYFNLKKSGCSTVDRVNDREEFALTVEGMQACGMSQEDITNVFRVVSAVLWMGQIDFKAKGDASEIKDMAPVKLVSNLLGCEQKLLETAMVSREIIAGASSKPIITPLKLEQAEYTRDALTKATYFRLFDYIVAKINAALALEKIEFKHVKTIGVLDIYGFEIFENNSFEQFCINFVNEKLQQIFIEKTLKSEQEEYMREGIKWTPVQYFNNKIVCDLIEAKPIGILAFLDEECLLGKGTDMTFLEKIEKNFSAHAHFERVRTKGTTGADTWFVVKHYAGDVCYNVVGFLDKNKDLVWKDLLLVGESSRMPCMQEMFPAGGARDMGKARPVTAGSHFKNQVNVLMTTLGKCQPHYIRCIKPNDQKKAGLFQDALNMHQIRYLGLLENVRVRRAGFAFRMAFNRFLRRYKMLCPETWPTWNDDDSKGCKLILKACNIAQGEQYQMGVTKVFIRNPVSVFTMEELRERKCHDLATLIQKVYRSWKARKYFLELREKSLNLFGRNKPRRRISIRRYYVGDYLNVSTHPTITQMLHKFGDRNVLFVDEVDKVNKRYKTQKRVLLLSSKGIYNLGTGKYKLNRRIEIQRVYKVSVSKKPDNYFILHVEKEYDYIYICERKTEFLTALVDEYQILTGRKLEVTCDNTLTYLMKAGKKATISFVDDPKVTGNVHYASRGKKDELTVAVGNIETVSASQLDKYTPAKMTKGAEKPRPGKPQHIRGISVAKAKAPAPTGIPQGRLGGQAGGTKPAVGPARDKETTAPAPAPAPAVRTGGGGGGKKAASPPASPRRAEEEKSSGEVWAKATDDFAPGDERELGFKRGDVIRILAQDPNGWWSGDLNGKLGFVPSTYLELVKGPVARKDSYARPVPKKAGR